MASYALRQRLAIMPVGWGFSSLHTVDYGKSVAVVITDGGSLPKCYDYVAKRQRHLVCELKDALACSDLVAWIISHFDYDHISLVAQLLKVIDKSADICIMPFTYSEQACREALASYLAFVAYELGRPRLPEALESALSRCRAIKLAKRGFKLRIDDSVYYEFLWPSHTHIGSPDVCSRIQKELERRINESCERDRDRCRNLKDLSTMIREKLDKLAKIGDAKPVDKSGSENDELDIRDILSQRERAGERSYEESARPHPIENLLSEEYVTYTGYRFSRALELYELREVKKSLENAYSLAYIIRSSQPQEMRLEVSTEGEGPICTYQELSLSNSTSNKALSDVLIYLGDLDDSSAERALEGYIPTRVLILVPAHHGNSWPSAMRKVSARLTYLNRCHYPTHVPASFKRGLRLRDLTRSGSIGSDFVVVVVMGNHRYKVSLCMSDCTCQPSP